MKTDDILLVIEKQDTTEINYILKNSYSNIKKLEECGVDISMITDKIFNQVGGHYIAKYCSDHKELVDFYNGKFNTFNDYSIKMDKSDKFITNKLKRSLRPRYEKKDISVHVGGVINNTNGSNYKVIDILDKRESSLDVILIDIKSMNIIAAHGLQYFDIKYGDKDIAGGLSESGYEWGHGIYYGPITNETNMRAIYIDNLPEGKKIKPADIYEHRSMILHEYVCTNQILDDNRYDVTIREAAANVLANKFYDMDYQQFDKALMEGRFDHSFKANTKRIEIPEKKDDRRI